MIKTRIQNIYINNLHMIYYFSINMPNLSNKKLVTHELIRRQVRRPDKFVCTKITSAKVETTADTEKAFPLPYQSNNNFIVLETLKIYPIRPKPDQWKYVK
mgnify:CR=1 FL=1